MTVCDRRLLSALTGAPQTGVVGATIEEALTEAALLSAAPG